MDSDYLEAAVGRVVFEVELFLASESGRPKHTDLSEQGAWLLHPIVRGLQALEEAEGAALGDVYYMGEGPSGLDVVASERVGEPVGPFPEDVVRSTYASFVGIIRGLAEVIGRAANALDDPMATFTSGSNPNTIADVLAICTSVLEGAELPEPNFEPWADAFDQIRERPRPPMD